MLNPQVIKHFDDIIENAQKAKAIYLNQVQQAEAKPVKEVKEVTKKRRTKFQTSVKVLEELTIAVREYMSARRDKVSNAQLKVYIKVMTEKRQRVEEVLSYLSKEKLDEAKRNVLVGVADEMQALLDDNKDVRISMTTNPKHVLKDIVGTIRTLTK